MNLPAWQTEYWRKLVNARGEGRLAHALLLAGAHGLGKRDFADALVRALLCESADADGMACGRCRGCRLVQAGSHPDRVVVGLQLRDDGKLRNEIVVDQIRALSAHLAMTPQFGGYQVAVLDPADAMNANAADALLKTLEEPGPATLILLVADQPMRLPATIRSRCQRIELRMPAFESAAEWLIRQGVDARQARDALQASGGNPGLALEWIGSGGLALRSEVAADLRALREGSVTAVELAARWSGTDAESRLWFGAALVQAEAAAQVCNAVGPLALTAPVDLTKLSAWYDHANRARAWLRGPLRPELVMLDALASWSAAGAQPPRRGDAG